MPTTSVEIPDLLKEKIEEKVERGEYTSNSDLIRHAVRKLLEEESLSPQAITELNKRLDYEKEDLKDLEKVR